MKSIKGARPPVRLLYSTRIYLFIQYYRVIPGKLVGYPYRFNRFKPVDYLCVTGYGYPVPGTPGYTGYTGFVYRLPRVLYEYS